MEKKRIIFLPNNFGEKEIDLIIEELFLLNQEPGEIILQINSSGGNFKRALNLYDVIIHSPNEVRAVVTGRVMSAAVLILLACKKRWASENSQFLIHEVSFNSYYKITPNSSVDDLCKNIRTKFDEVKNDNKKLVQILTTHLSMPKKEIINFLKLEKILDLKEAKKMNIINE